MALLLGAGHDAVAWLLSLARLARTKALVFNRQALPDPQLPLAVLARIHLTFHAFFESVLQGGGPALLPDLSTIVRELRKRCLVCPRLPPAMHRLLGLAFAPSTRLQIGPGRNLGSCIRTGAAVGNPPPH
jgi:hypothetical protein